VQQKRWEAWFENRRYGLFHRQIIFLSGSPTWATQQALALTEIAKKSGYSRASWVGNSSAFTVRGLPFKQFKKLLGQECDIGVFNAHDGIFPSALLALSGTIRANGLLLICCPTWVDWPLSPSSTNERLISHGYSSSYSHFISTWQEIAERDPSISIFQEHHQNDTLPCNAPITKTPNPSLAKFASRDQERAFTTAIESMHYENIAIVAKRGRGKSTLLGMLADEFTASGRNVRFCTSLKNNVKTALDHSKCSAAYSWYAPDDTSLDTDTDVLFIDEAANLPVASLLRLTKLCKQFVVATTTDGYEGTGQGFINKLLPKLKQDKSLLPLKTIAMRQPLRYSADDVLEQHFDALFYLNPAMTHFSAPPCVNALSAKIIKNKQLLPHSELQECMSLLSLSHYQTSPDDTIRMMDSPDHFLVTLASNSQLIGVAVIIEEGNGKLFPLEEDIASGERRPKGHQLAQKLSLLLSDANVLKQKIWRINRIAVNPSIQNQGFGSHLIKGIEAIALQQHVDLLGASFGQNEKTTRFWLNNNFKPVYLGNSADKSTGETALFVLKALSRQASPILTLAYGSYISEEYENNDEHSQLDKINRKKILDYVNGSRSIHHMGNALTHWYQLHSHDLMKYAQVSEETEKCVALLKRKWINKDSDLSLIQNFRYKGQKKLYQALYDAFSQCYWYIASL
jgi:tRNA(Met) cytidine acetyltransferase